MFLLYAALILYADVLVPSNGGIVPVNTLSAKKASHRTQIREHKSVLKGWYYIAEKLIGDGIDETIVRGVYNDARMPSFTKIPFALKPKEGPALYSELSTTTSVALAKQCLKRYYGHFTGAEREFNVPKKVLASILFVESRCGTFTGKSAIIYRLSRLASVGEPENLVYNYNEHRKADPSVTFGTTVERASFLEETFYPQIKALIQLAALERQNIFGIRGSSAGAFGLPQFLPTNYFDYGVDGDGDSHISLYSPADAIWSAANYLSEKGYDNSLPLSSNRTAIWNYNHSEAYIDAVIFLAENL